MSTKYYAEGYEKGEQLYGVIVEKLPIEQRKAVIADLIEGITEAMHECLAQDEEGEE
jgi:hypothetical protein